MSEIWAVNVSVILLLIIYGIVSSRLEKRNKLKIRAKTIPMVTDYPTTDVLYNIHLSDGRKFLSASLIGSVEGDDANFSFAGYDGMVVVKLDTGKRAFIKKSSIRYIEEV